MSIIKVISDLHGVKPTYVETVPVTETIEGKIVWEGDVEVFDIKNHPKAQRVYAWKHLTGENDEQTRYVTVLHVAPVDSPQTAVN